MAEKQFSTPEEIWKAIPGFTGYEASTHGRVRSYWRHAGIKGKFGQGFKMVLDNCPRLLKGRLVRGYHTVDLSRANNPNLKKNPLEKIHRLILITFVGPCPPRYECRHLDGIKSNNFLTNLCWGTRSENELDKINHGAAPNLKGIKNHFSKLSDTQVLEIRNLYSQGYTLSKIGKMFNICYSNISHIINHKTWRHLP